jgi:hypothetical protein
VKKCVIVLAFVTAGLCCKAQGYGGSINNLISAAGNYQQSRQPEKLYLQLDKLNYNLNDTLWLKAYLFNAATLKASAKSSIVYIEISDESNVMRLRRQVILTDGLGSGSIALNGLDYPEGNYTIRAYTQWMRNFNESLVFKKQFTISNIDRDKWLINFNSAIQNQTAQLHLRLTETDKLPIANQQVLLGVRQGELVLRRDKPQITSPNGELDLAVAVRSNPAPVYASLHKGSYDDAAPLYKFPVIYNRPINTAIQFMPEGGYLVTGISSIVGFKAIGEDGNGTIVTGSIVNARTNEEVASFRSNSKGMGSFAFTPQPGMNCKAIVNLPGGIKKEYLLPEIKLTGTVLTVTNPDLNDSVILKITTSPGLNNRYTLLGESRGLLCAAARVVLVNNTQTLKLPKSAFASGIVRFTLLNEQLATLNERIIYIDHHDNLQINVTADKTAYNPQDSIALHLEVKDSNGNPVRGAFSMSVVNDLPLNDNQHATSIATSLLLTSDLKGEVEDPDYYLLAGHGNDLDNLLLTQGWTAFDWKEVFLPEKRPAFMAETAISIGGKVTNLFNKPVKNIQINLQSIKPSYSMDTQTDGNGNFIFKGMLQTDSTVFIKARNAKDHSSTYGIELYRYQQEWPVFSKNKLQMPWYVITDTVHQKIADTLISYQEKAERLEDPSGKVLKQVDIKEKKIIKGSHNLNGPGNADQVIDEHDIAKEGKLTLLELLKKKVQGFRVEGMAGRKDYFIGAEAILRTNPPKGRGPFNPQGGFIFDGVRIENVYDGAIYELLNSYTSDDIKGIEVMSKTYTSAYEMGYLTSEEIQRIIFPAPFIEITTRDGLDPLRKKTPADLVYRPVLSVSPKQFYRPAYPVKNSVAAAFDRRTTIHWEPNIVTDKDGKATVTFYAAGQPATYTVTTEGSNMSSSVGSSVQKIIVTAGSL